MVTLIEISAGKRILGRMLELACQAQGMGRLHWDEKLDQLLLRRIAPASQACQEGWGCRTWSLRTSLEYFLSTASHAIFCARNPQLMSTWNNFSWRWNALRCFTSMPYQMHDDQLKILTFWTIKGELIASVCGSIFFLFSGQVQRHHHTGKSSWP